MLRLAFLAHTDALGAGNAVRHKGQIHREGLGVAAFNYAYIVPTIAYAYVACDHGGVVPPCWREVAPIEGLSTPPSLLGIPCCLTS